MKASERGESESLSGEKLELEHSGVAVLTH